MRVSRRAVMAGALAVPTVAGLASWRWAHGEGAVLLHDPSLAAGRRFAEAGRVAGGRVLALTGDAIRMAQQVLMGSPGMIAGVSRHSDALLIEEAAQEAGYVRVAALEGLAGRCTSADCRPGWHALGRLAQSAGAAWPEALASYAAAPSRADAVPISAARPADPHHAFGWLLARRA